MLGQTIHLLRGTTGRPSKPSLNSSRRRQPRAVSVRTAEERIATFDQDGTLWVEHPIYTQVMYCLEKVPALVKAKPELANVAPFNTVLELLHGDRAAMEKLICRFFLKVLAATSTGMPVETFQAEAKKWLGEAKDPRWRQPYTDLIYLPMQEVLEISSRQRLQDLHRHRRRAGFCARLFRASLWRPARTSRR